MFNLCNLPGFETFSDIKSVLALFAVTIKKKMTANIPKPVEFGFFLVYVDIYGYFVAILRIAELVGDILIQLSSK